MLSTKAKCVFIDILDKIEDKLVEYEANYQSVTKELILRIYQD
jgi:hypothetical protein